MSTAGTVTASPINGFDVSGTHTYGGTGSFTVAVTITDVGGSATTASATATATATARVAAAPRPFPLPPPFPFPVALPHAAFGFSPLSPCQSQYVGFDASGSTGGDSSAGPLPITQYRWSFDESAFAPAVVLTTSPCLSHRFLPSSYGPGPYEGPLPNPRGNLFDYHYYRPPANVTLEVTNSAGRTGSVTQRITFRDPVRIISVIVPIDPVTGLPDFSHARPKRNDPRYMHAIPRAKQRPVYKLAGSAKLKLGRINLKRASVTLRPSGTSITVKSPCRSGPVDCFGELIVTAGTHGQAIPPNPIRGSLGHTTFFAPAGRSATVVVRLNARGTALGTRTGCVP
ncbi:MAG: hypothetical protein ACR2QA_03630 [Solirubrobacteraceae bacterium]